MSRRNLPHWEQAGKTYFVTFRLNDSLPESKLSELEAERKVWLSENLEPWGEAQRRQYYDRFSARLDEWLDAGSGACLLHDAQVAKTVADALRHFDGDRYDLGAWVVMPNHVHVVVTPRGEHRLGEILHSWKSFTAHAINQLLGSAGQLWQHESYDHLVRNERALERVEEYIDRNPEMARIRVAQASRLPGAEDRKRDARATLPGDEARKRDARATLPGDEARKRDGRATLPGDEARKRDARATLPNVEVHSEIRVQIESPGDGWSQDPDTLDTWFSSWLWAYETMDAETRAKFYPTSVLVTAPDIIFFWVARMIIAGLEFTPGRSERDEDNIPFRDVFFTGLIRDQSGRKMSKSLGNSPDPLDLIAKYGADGLRFGLMRIAPSGQDIRFDEKQIEEGRNFATKLWNAARFRQMHGPSEAAPNLKDHELSIYAIELLARFDELLKAVETGYAEYRFSEVAQRLYEFFWSDYCDWFIEAAKTDIFSEVPARKASVLAVMDFVFSGFLRLLHPFMPHITEELWFVFGFGVADTDLKMSSIEFSQPPTPSGIEDPREVRKKVTAVYETVVAGRNLRAASRIPSNKKARFVLREAEGGQTGELATIVRLLNAAEIARDAKFEPEAGAPVAVTPLGELYLIVVGGDKAAEGERLDKEIAKLELELRTVNQKLANSSFVDKAPRAVVEEHERRKSDFAAKLAQLRQSRAALN